LWCNVLGYIITDRKCIAHRVSVLSVSSVD
jgi:hypothetical protein